jgi:hypothetical protein
MGLAIYFWKRIFVVADFNPFLRGNTAVNEMMQVKTVVQW